MDGNARGGDDTLTGSGGILMYGDAEFMYDNARGGDDTLNGSRQWRRPRDAQQFPRRQ